MRVQDQTTKIEQFVKSIHYHHSKDIHNKEHSSYFFKTTHYTLLLTRFFALKNDALDGITTPYIISDAIILKYNRKENRYEIMEKGHESIQESIDQELAKSEKLVMQYIEEVDQLEDELYMRKLSPIFLDVWFDLKKDITRIERILERVYETLKLYTKYHETLESFPHEGFINIIEHIKRYQRLAALNSNKLDTLYNYYNSLKSDKMNNNIYALTILSGIFLPLNLIVGFFGMNTEGLYFSGNPNGTFHVVLILLSLFFVFVALIPIISIIERLILRRLLGRFNLYNKLVSNIKNISLFNNK